MKKIIFTLLLFIFFLDFSFLPIVSKDYLGGGYLLLDFLIILLIERSWGENLLWIILTAWLLNIVNPFNFLGFVFILMVSAGIITLIKMIFIDERLNLLKRNILFGSAFFSYEIFFQLFSGWRNGTLSFGNFFVLGSLTGSALWFKFLIIVVLYNILYFFFLRLTTLKSNDVFSGK